MLQSREELDDVQWGGLTLTSWGQGIHSFPPPSLFFVKEGLMHFSDILFNLNEVVLKLFRHPMCTKMCVHP